MDIRDRQSLKQAAAQRLQAASYDPRKLTLLHRGIIVGISLVISLISLGLADGIASTSGLSGIGTRNLLQTAQSALQLGQLLLTPFWQIGILFSFICLIRNRYAGPGSLLRGFSRFGPAFRLMLLQGLMFMGVSQVAMYISSFIALPFSPKLMEILDPIATQMMADPYYNPMPALMELPPDVLLKAAAPVLLVFCVLYFLAVAFLSLQMRFSNYLILDDPKVGAFAAVGMSFRLNHKHFWTLLRLDLSFWLYYLLHGLALGISMLQLLVPSWHLPISEEVAGLLFYGIYGIAVLVIDWFMRPMVEATYALAYSTLKEIKYPAK